MYNFDQGEVIEVHNLHWHEAANGQCADTSHHECKLIVLGCQQAHPGVQAFLKSWGMILLSEIGDKTFFIAAIMAMRNSRRVVSLLHQLL
jgi:hypothetical protein